MAYDKIVDSQQLNTGLGAICDAVREKTGCNDFFEFPDEIAQAVSSIENEGTTPGTEVTMASTISTMNEFAEAVFPLWPNGLEPNSFYVCFWNGLFDGSTPTADQVGYIATWTDAAGIARTSGAGCCRYRGGWATINNISSNWACAVSIGDKYTWYKIA